MNHLLWTAKLKKYRQFDRFYSIISIKGVERAKKTPSGEEGA
jgi:hypothetical protein